MSGQAGNKFPGGNDMRQLKKAVRIFHELPEQASTRTNPDFGGQRAPSFLD
jgi:hypothetical protein